MKLWGYALVGKRKSVGNVNDVASYTVPYNSANILRRGTSGLSVDERVRVIGDKAKSHACRYLKTMGERVDLAFYVRVVVESLAVKIAELRGVPLQGGATE